MIKITPRDITDEVKRNLLDVLRANLPGYIPVSRVSTEPMSYSYETEMLTLSLFPEHKTNQTGVYLIRSYFVPLEEMERALGI